MGLKLIHISKRGNWWSNPLDMTLVVLTINCLCKTFPDFAIKVLCFLTTITPTFKFQLMVHGKLSWRNCKCPVDFWQPGQIVPKKFQPSKNPVCGYVNHRRLVPTQFHGLRKHVYVTNGLPIYTFSVFLDMISSYLLAFSSADEDATVLGRVL